MNVHFSSKSNEWSTPQDFFDRLNDEFHFTIDAAANLDNAKCERFWTPDSDGLAQDWKGERVFCNPPYGRAIADWIEKAANSGADVTVMLIPARTDTKAWHKWIFGKAEIRFVEGRLKFSGGGTENPHKWNAPFPCAVVVFRAVPVGGCDI